MSDLRCLAHEGAPAHRASPGRHDREAVWPRWRASGDRGESPAQAATDRPAPCSPAGAAPGVARPAELRMGVAVPRQYCASRWLMCAFNTAMSAQQHLDKPEGAQGEPELA